MASDRQGLRTRLTVAASASVQYVLAYGVALPAFAVHKLVRRSKARRAPVSPGAP